MSHSLDTNRLKEVFEALRDNTERLNEWENERLEEWYDRWTNDLPLSDRQLECLERMYLRI